MPINQLKTAADLTEAFQEWNTSLYRYAYARVRNHQTVEDLIQEVFIKAWRSRKSFDPEKSSLKNWLYAITINTIRDYFRNQAVRPATTSIEEDEKPDELNLSDQIENQDTIKFVFKQMRQLTDREQELLLLRYREDFDIPEIAEIVGMEYSATKVAIHRAIKRLQTICNNL